MKTVTVYGCCLGPQCGNATALLLEPWPTPQRMSINGGPEFECDTDLSWDVLVPDDAELVTDSTGLLSLHLSGRTYSANQVLAMADLELNGLSRATGAPSS